MHIKLFILMISLGLLACNQEDPLGGCSSTPDDIMFRFSLKNSENQDLLDPNMEDTFNTYNILLYHKKGDEYVLSSQNNGFGTSDEHGYDIYNNDGSYEFAPLNMEFGLNLHELKIDWGNGRIDFISVECLGNNCVKYADKIRYNNELVWNRASGEPKHFTIIVEK
ncbi:hypothetical protein [Flagellimonas sp.]|uniref:hypothetical protein n=1 Tax=Flagellimonas sp. TaxID=2058762 RepID=UPI003BB1617E